MVAWAMDHVAAPANYSCDIQIRGPDGGLEQQVVGCSRKLTDEMVDHTLQPKAVGDSRCQGLVSSDR